MNLRSVRVHLESGSRRIMLLRGGNYYLYLGGLKLEMISGVHPTLSLKPVAGVCSTRGGGCSLLTSLLDPWETFTTQLSHKSKRQMVALHSFSIPKNTTSPPALDSEMPQGFFVRI